MFNFQSASNVQLADLIRALCEDKSTTIPAQSTLLRLKKDDLLKRVVKEMGTEFHIGEDGYPVRAPDAASLQAALTDPDGFQTVLNAEGVDYEPAGVSGSVHEDLIFVETPLTPAEAVELFTEPSSKVEAPAKAAGTSRGAKPLQANDAVITVLVAANPKRDGSATAARFGLMKSGMTVAAYIAAVEAATGTAKRARRTLRKAVAAGQVTVSGEILGDC